MLHMPYSVLIYLSCAPTLQGQRRNITLAFYLLRPTPLQRITPVALCSWWDNCWHWSLVGKVPQHSLYVKIPLTLNLTECYKKSIVDKRVCNLKASVLNI